MEVEELKRKETKAVKISVRTYPSYSKFMEKYNISPTLLFNKAIEELMEKQEKKEKK